MNFLEQLTAFFAWTGWGGVSVIILSVTAGFIGWQAYVTRKIFQFQTIPSVAFSLMSTKTFYEKLKMGAPNSKDKQDTQFMINNLSKFPISFWIKAEDDAGDGIFSDGPWRINPGAFFKPHTKTILEMLSKKQKSEVYIYISYSPLHDESLRIYQKPERWKINTKGRWVDKHGMEDKYDRYWDKFLFKLNQRTNRKGTT